jgi:dsDNA-specific endonuclease/ATPase MutS2
VTRPEDPGEVEVPITGELDLHTFHPSETKDLVTEYLRACRERGILEVRVVHGKGTGALRETVHAALRGISFVRDFRLAGEAAAGWLPFDGVGRRGGWGATMVRLWGADDEPREKHR